jgi:hypothetical protein
MQQRMAVKFPVFNLPFLGTRSSNPPLKQLHHHPIFVHRSVFRKKFKDPITTQDGGRTTKAIASSNLVLILPATFSPTGASTVSSNLSHA